MATPAAPAPLNTTLQSLRSFLTTLIAFKIAAAHTTAVPCWSSWKIGISVHALSFSSISKQRGAEISSRFTPPKLPEISCTVLTISSTSFDLIQRGNASTPPNALNNTHFPSITGIPASGPISPRPSTAVPSVTTATIFQRRVRSYDFEISFCISRQGCATPGVYASDNSSFVFTEALGVHSIFPFHW